jgi:hypothetical protein
MIMAPWYARPGNELPQTPHRLRKCCRQVLRDSTLHRKLINVANCASQPSMPSYMRCSLQLTQFSILKTLLLCPQIRQIPTCRFSRICFMTMDTATCSGHPRSRAMPARQSRRRRYPDSVLLPSYVHICMQHCSPMVGQLLDLCMQQCENATEAQWATSLPRKRPDSRSQRHQCVRRC